MAGSLKLTGISLLALAGLALLAMALLSMPPVITSLHAEAHTEAGGIRQCNNILQIWINKSCERFNILKQLDDGRVGDQVVQPCKRGVIEITSYVIAGGTLEEATAILAAKGCTLVWMP